MSDRVVSLPVAMPPPPTPPLARPPSHFLRMDAQQLDHNNTIAFFHPGYCLDGRHDPVVELLRLPAYDNGGFHHGTALSALSIIAHNKSGYFTTDAPTGERVGEGWDYILPSSSNYYYHLDDSTITPRYPICSSFSDWHLDPHTIPLKWRAAFHRPTSITPVVTRSHMSSGVRQRDVSCRITDSLDATENAHIVPRSEDVWFLLNGLHIYNFSLHDPAPSAIDDVQNGMLLRRDIHFVFDQKVFCAVVKEGVVVSHYLKRTHDMAAVYHNAEMRLPGADPPVEFFWARLAWSVVPHVAAFDAKLRLLGRVGVEVEVEEVGEEEEDVVARRKGRGAVGGKRKRGGAGAGGPLKRGGGVVGRSVVLANCRAVKRAGTPSDPEHVSKRQLAQEMKRDQSLREHFFPQMKEETTWSDNATWQSANWYPGIEHMERIKSWWRANNPQITQSDCREYLADDKD